jgi:hypothetical protein
MQNASEDTHGAHQTSSDSIDVGTRIGCHRGLEKREEEEQQQEGGRHGEDEEQLGPGDPRVPGGLAPSRRNLAVVEDPLGPERALLQLTREGAHARFIRSDRSGGSNGESGARELPLRQPRKRRRRRAGDPASAAARGAGGGRRGGARPWRNGAPRCGPQRRAPAWSASPWAMAMALLSLGVP